ncbi:MAG: diguanylate cyclase [Sandaracinaceae bacterium]
MTRAAVSDVPVDAKTLDDFAMLEGVGVGPRKELIASAVQRGLTPGDILIHQGTRGASMYLVLRGELSVHLDSVDADPVATIGQGETVGELSVLDGSDASAFVVAKEPTRVLEVKEEDFWHLTNASHAFAVNLLLKLAERLRNNNRAVSQNVKKRRQYERAAMFDGLTGIHNRRWLDETLHRLVRRAEGSHEHLTVSLIDIDHFKSFNDTYGHAAGDHVLTVVATTLASNLRPTDLVARFGGEEFVILFPSTGLEHALIAAERVRAAVSTQTMVMSDGTVLPPVTISMGVAELRPPMSVPDLLKTADLAMYRAKQAGRNRVVAGDTAS